MGEGAAERGRRMGTAKVKVGVMSLGDGGEDWAIGGRDRPIST